MQSYGQILKELFRRYAITAGVMWFVLLMIAWGLHAFEYSLLGWLVRDWNMKTEKVAHFFYVWGDFITGSVIVATIVFFAGWLAGRPDWKRAAWASLMAAALAGLMADVIRASTARPRPRWSLPGKYYPADAQAYYNKKHDFIPDQFYYFSIQKRFNSFPSAHAATSMGSAAALAIAAPAWGIPVVGLAGVVVWSRMYKLEHYPTDVMVGSALGWTFGLWLGAAARRRQET